MCLDSRNFSATHTLALVHTHVYTHTHTHIYIYIYIYIYTLRGRWRLDCTKSVPYFFIRIYQTPLPQVGCDTDFSFSLTSCRRSKSALLFKHWFEENWWIRAFRIFVSLRANASLARRETKTAPSKVWTQVADSISNDYCNNTWSRT